MKPSTLPAKVLFVIVIAVSLNVTGFAQNQEAMNTAQKYLTALETVQFQAAYELVSEEDRSAKTLAQFQKENPVVFIKAMQIDDRTFNTFAIKGFKEENNALLVTVTTTEFAWQGPVADLLEQLKPAMLQQHLDPTNPDQVNAAIKKWLKDDSFKGNPLPHVERVIRVVRTNDKWYISTGWKEAADKQIEEQAAWIIDTAKNSATSDYSDAIQKLRAMKQQVPKSQKINDGLALLEKCRSGMAKIILTASDPVAEPPFKAIKRVEISNKSDMKPKFFIIEYSLLDSNGNTLLTTESQTGSEMLDPPAPNGCIPGYTGIIANAYGTDDKELIQKWVRTKARVKGVTYSFD